jgi:hypothetical protein
MGSNTHPAGVGRRLQCWPTNPLVQLHNPEAKQLPSQRPLPSLQLDEYWQVAPENPLEHSQTL